MAPSVLVLLAVCLLTPSAADAITIQILFDGSLMDPRSTGTFTPAEEKVIRVAGAE